MLHEEPLGERMDALRRDRVAVDAYLEDLEARARSIEPEIESLVPEEGRWERLHEAATDLEARYPDPTDRPPLYGIPVGVKDIFHVSGLPTRAGSGVPPETLTGDEGDAVRTLRAAGALVLGKTVTAEFAHFEPGPTRNPHDPEHTPGGSSSGSAAAVAAGLCPLALGSQTIGSVIRPAAFCGIVGFKPSYGRISREGVIGVSESIDQVGFFTQTTDGVDLVAALLCDGWRPLPEPRDPPTLGVPAGPYLQQADGVGRDAFDDHVARLESAGYDVEFVDAFGNIDEINERHERLVAAEFAIAHEAWYEEHPEGYAGATVDLIGAGRPVTADGIAAGRLGRQQLRTTLTDRMDERGIDIWIAPAAPGPAPEGIDTTGDPIMNLPWTHAGLPTIALPAGKTDDGLPVGVQCAARFGAGEDLVAWSRGIAEGLSVAG